MLFDLARTLVEIFIVIGDCVQSIVCPIERKMPIYLVNQILLERLFSKSRKLIHPSIEVFSLIVISESLIIVLDNLNERTHYLGEENNTDEHEYNSKDHFSGAEWI